MEAYLSGTNTDESGNRRMAEETCSLGFRSAFIFRWASLLGSTRPLEGGLIGQRIAFLDTHGELHFLLSLRLVCTGQAWVRRFMTCIYAWAARQAFFRLECN